MSIYLYKVSVNSPALLTGEELTEGSSYITIISSNKWLSFLLAEAENIVADTIKIISSFLQCCYTCLLIF